MTHIMASDTKVFLCGAGQLSETTLGFVLVSDALRLYRDGVLGREVTCVDCCAALRASAAEVGR